MGRSLSSTSILLAAVVSLSACGPQVSFKAGPFAATCQSDDQIPSLTRSEIESAAIEFVALMIESPGDAAAKMSKLGKSELRPGSLDAVEARYQTLKGLPAPVVTQTFFVETNGAVGTGSGLPCGTSDGRMAIVPRGGTQTNALALVTHAFPTGLEITSTLWLEHEDGHWLVRGLHVGASAIAGLEGEELWALAKSQRSSEHLINAHLLYMAARDVMDRGPFFQAPALSDFNTDAQSFSPSAVLRGPPPFVWTFDGEAFEVSNVRWVNLITGKLALAINRVVATGTKIETVDAANRRLIDGFDAAYPEWREVFNSVIVWASSPDGSNLRETAFSVDAGYMAPSGIISGN